MKQPFAVRSTAVRVLVGCACCALVACSDSSADDINTWMAEQGATLKPRVTAIEAPCRGQVISYKKIGREVIQAGEG